MSANISAELGTSPDLGVRVLLDALPEPALVLESSALVRMANRAARARFGAGLVGAGLAGAGLVGQTLTARMPSAAGTALLRYLALCSGSREPLPGAISLDGAESGPMYARCLASVLVPAREAAPALLLLRCTEGGFERFSALARMVRDLNAELHGRRRTQAVLEDALRDRELMLRELHHRVKNSIQVLTGMVAAARRDAEEPAARAVLDEAARRLAAMAAVHQMLYRAENIGGLQAERFMAELTASTLRPLGAEARASGHASPGATVPNDAAVPLALILNELLANAVKHGPAGGRIHADLTDRGTAFELAVEDDGPGFIPPRSLRRASGLALVRGLVRQLGGSFAVERGERGEARCVVRFDARREPVPDEATA